MGKFKKEHGKSRLGLFIKNNAPKLWDAVEDVLPEKGALGVVKNLIASSDELTPEEKVEAQELAELDLQAFELEVEDRKSGRELYKIDSIIQKVLAIVFTVAYFAVTYSLINHFFGNTDKLEDYELGFLSTLFGAMSAKVNTIIDFFFGGSVKG